MKKLKKQIASLETAIASPATTDAEKEAISKKLTELKAKEAEGVKEKPAKKKKKKAKKAKKQPKKVVPDCDELEKRYKKRRTRAKKARVSKPKKTGKIVQGERLMARIQREIKEIGSMAAKIMTKVNYLNKAIPKCKEDMEKEMEAELKKKLYAKVSKKAKK